MSSGRNLKKKNESRGRKLGTVEKGSKVTMVQKQGITPKNIPLQAWVGVVAGKQEQKFGYTSFPQYGVWWGDQIGSCGDGLGNEGRSGCLFTLV